MAKRGRPKQPPKKYDLITEDSKEGKEVLAMIPKVVKAHRKELAQAKIGAAWMIGKKADRDGRVTLGKLKRTTELERKQTGLDALVLLNQDYWRKLTEPQRVALIHHELCHLAQALGPDGVEQLVDGHGALRWRTVKHDIEEFRAVVKAHGCYLDDIRHFAQDLLEKDPQLDLFQEPKAPAGLRAVG